MRKSTALSYCLDSSSSSGELQMFRVERRVCHWGTSILRGTLQHVVLDRTPMVCRDCCFVLVNWLISDFPWEEREGKDREEFCTNPETNVRHRRILIAVPPRLPTEFQHPPNSLRSLPFHDNDSDTASERLSTCTATVTTTSHTHAQPA